MLGDTAAAVTLLERLAAVQPGSAAAHYELGVTLAEAGRQGEQPQGNKRQTPAARDRRQPSGTSAQHDNATATGVEHG